MAEDDVEPHAAMDEDDYEDGTAPVHVDVSMFAGSSCSSIIYLSSFH